MSILFDPEADVLYISFGEPVAATSEEVEPGILIRKVDEKIVGVTVLDLTEHLKTKPRRP